MKIEDTLDAAFLFFFSSSPPSFFCLQSVLECNVVKGQHLCLHCFSLYKLQQMKTLFFPNMRLREMNCALYLIIGLGFFPCFSFDWFCVVMIITLFVGWRERCFLIKLDENHMQNVNGEREDFSLW